MRTKFSVTRSVEFHIGRGRNDQRSRESIETGMRMNEGDDPLVYGLGERKRSNHGCSAAIRKAIEVKRKRVGSEVSEVVGRR